MPPTDMSPMAMPDMSMMRDDVRQAQETGNWLYSAGDYLWSR